MEVFAERLRLYQKQKGLNQKQLAELAGVTQGTMSAYMRNANSPTIDMISEIAKRLDVSIGWLCGEDNCRKEIHTFGEAMRCIVDLANALPYTDLSTVYFDGERVGRIDFLSSVINDFIEDYGKIRKVSAEVKDLPSNVVQSWLDSAYRKWDDSVIDADNIPIDVTPINIDEI